MSTRSRLKLEKQNLNIMKFATSLIFLFATSFVGMVMPSCFDAPTVGGVSGCYGTLTAQPEFQLGQIM